MYVCFLLLCMLVGLTLILACDRVDECWSKAGCSAGPSRPHHVQEVSSMAEDIREDYVQVCGAVCGHEEG